MSVVDEVKERIDIIELIDGYTRLSKAGRNYKGLCPFHTEKTPSFVVFPESQNYRCFGCGRGGDVFNFIMDIEGFDFRGALQMLAERAGVELRAETPERAEQREYHDRLLGLLNDTAHFFYKQLTEAHGAEHARQYVGKRGLTWESIEQFAIGYAPNSWDATMNYLLNLGYEQQDLNNAGLVVVKESGGIYDRFRNRLVVPIYNAQGNVVGFGARILDPNDIPKYLNSPQSLLFDKSTLLYGFHLARRSIRETETVVIVEGYMDVIQAHQAGFENVVAQMGTALTGDQLKLLARYARTIILALDPDSAGQMATERGRETIERASKEAASEIEGWALDSAEQDHRARLTTEFDPSGMLRYENDLGFDIRVLSLPAGQDPDDLIRVDPDEWIYLTENALPIVEYAIQNAVEGQNLDDPKVKSRIVENITPLINKVSSSVERSYYRQKLARLLRIPEGALLLKSNQTPPKAQQTRQQPQHPVQMPAQAETILTSPTAKRESFCLAAMVRYPRMLYRANRILAEALAFDDMSESMGSIVDVLSRSVTKNDFAQTEHRYIFETWCAALDQHEWEPIDYLLDRLDPSLSDVVNSWLSQPLYALRNGTQPDKVDIPEKRVLDDFILGVLELRKKRLEEILQEFIFLAQDDHTATDILREEPDTIRFILKAQQLLGRTRHEYSLSGKLEKAIDDGVL